jgi:endo-1,4-beta-mannosidase
VTVYFRRWRATERRGVTDVTRITRTITIDEERVWGDGYKTFGDKQGEAPVMSQNCL